MHHLVLIYVALVVAAVSLLLPDLDVAAVAHPVEGHSYLDSVVFVVAVLKALPADDAGVAFLALVASVAHFVGLESLTADASFYVSVFINFGKSLKAGGFGVHASGVDVRGDLENVLEEESIHQGGRPVEISLEVTFGRRPFPETRVVILSLFDLFIREGDLIFHLFDDLAG